MFMILNYGDLTSYTIDKRFEKLRANRTIELVSKNAIPVCLINSILKKSRILVYAKWSAAPTIINAEQ